MSRFSQALRLWLPFAVIGAGLILLISVGIQQTYRMGANDPQIQMAEDAAAAIAQGATPQSQVPPLKVNISKSLDPFIIVTNESGTVMASSAQLDEATLLPPKGTLEAAKTNTGIGGQSNESRITWQPQEGVRLATVVVYHSGQNAGYVIVGRNLREIESREQDLTTMAALDFLGILIGTFLILLVTIRLDQSQIKHTTD